MRFALILILCLPLLAGDEPTLQQAIADFGSDVAAERDAASRAVRRRLEGDLAPLLEAMRAKDPEVSRRARDAIASFLPRRDVPEPAQLEQAGNVIWLRAFKGRNVRVVLQAGGGFGGRLVVDGADDPSEPIKKFGVDGYTVTDPLVRSQLGLGRGRGYAVNKVEPESAAEKVGLQKHDIVLRIGDTPVMQVKDVAKALGPKAKWNDLALRVLREGQVKRLGRLP